MRLARVAALGAASTLVGCALVSLDGLTGGDAGPDGAVTVRSDGAPADGTIAADAGDPDAEKEAGKDATGDASTPPGDAAADGTSDGAMAGSPVSIVSVGAVTAPSGAAQQGHLVWTAGTQQWWLFYVDAADPTALQATASSDFHAWSAGGTLTLPGPPSDGRNIAAWAGTAAGQDVVHLGVSVALSSTDRRHLHVRARPAGGALEFDPLVVLGAPYLDLSGLDPDGPATALGTDGTLLDTSGWFEGPDGGATGNEYGWSSTAPDPGGAWTPAFDDAQVVGQVPGYVNARAVVPLPGGSVLALWEAGDVDPDPTNVAFAVESGATWGPGGDVFSASTQDPNDWGACALGAAVHAVRHTSGGVWEHRVWTGTPTADGGTTFVDGGTIAALATPAAAGVVVLCDATRVHVFAIAPDAGNPIRTTSWDGSAWSAWSDAVAAPGQRTWLTGTVTPTGSIALAWTESAASPVAIAGALVAP
ncbi:MAG TPA: hypothetical protein VGG39_34080 [Polyangiaceae bacterium]|jgi:hypothetical protein